MQGSRKDCFGILDKVFPVGEEGLREIVPTCFHCDDKEACLETALTTKEGLQLRNEILERTPATGFLGRLMRWSEKKELSRLMKLREEEKK